MSYFREFPVVVFVSLFVLGGVCLLGEGVGGWVGEGFHGLFLGQRITFALHRKRCSQKMNSFRSFLLIHPPGCRRSASASGYRSCNQVYFLPSVVWANRVRPLPDFSR